MKISFLDTLVLLAATDTVVHLTDVALVLPGIVGIVPVHPETVIIAAPPVNVVTTVTKADVALHHQDLVRATIETSQVCGQFHR